jgi:osmotically inducible protein OsmC
MALSGSLEKNGTPPTLIETGGSCTVESAEGVSRITKMHLDVKATVPGIDDAKFQEIANATLTGCPVSKALQGNMEMTMSAALV